MPMYTHYERWNGASFGFAIFRAPSALLLGAADSLLVRRTQLDCALPGL